MKGKKPYLSVIIPIFNEEKRLHNLKRIYQFLNKQKFNFEVVLINDGSFDNTSQKLRDLSRKLNFRAISYEKNKGKGFAIKTGMLSAEGRYRLFIDIDLSTPIEEVNKLIKYLGKYDLVIGSRRIKGSIFIVRQPFVRESLGRVFTFLSQQILGVKISDFTCGFKCFSEKSAVRIFQKQKIERWGFDSEILYIAKKLGLSIKEIPVMWTNDPRTRVKFPEDVLRSLTDLYKIRYYNFKKFYHP